MRKTYDYTLKVHVHEKKKKRKKVYNYTMSFLKFNSCHFVLVTIHTVSEQFAHSLLWFFLAFFFFKKKHGTDRQVRTLYSVVTVNQTC